MDPSQRNLVNRLVLGGITALWLLFLDENKIGYSWTADVFRPAGETSHSSTPDFVFADNEIPADQSLRSKRSPKGFKFKPKEPPPQSREHDTFPDLNKTLPPLERRWQRVYLCVSGDTDHTLQNCLVGSREETMNEVGSEQAEALGIFLRNCPISKISSSELSRGLDTANRIHHWHPKAHRRRVYGLYDVDYGGLAFESLQNSTARRIYESVLASWEKGDLEVKFEPHGESLKEIDERLFVCLIHAGFSGLARTPNDHSHLCIVGHPLLYQIFLAGMLKINETQYLQTGTYKDMELVGDVTKFKQFGPLRPGSVSVVDLAPCGAIRIRYVGVSKHLEHSLPQKKTRHHYKLANDIRWQRESEKTPDSLGGVFEQYVNIHQRFDRGEIDEEERDRLKDEVLEMA